MIPKSSNIIQELISVLAKSTILPAIHITLLTLATITFYHI